MRKKFIYVLWALVVGVLLVIATYIHRNSERMDWICTAY